MTTLYEQVFEATKDIVTHWRTDITKHDRAALTGYSGDIIYAARECGTDLILLEDNPETEPKQARQNVDAAEVFTFMPNSHFWISKNGKLKKVSKTRAWNHWQAYRKRHKLPMVHCGAP